MPGIDPVSAISGGIGGAFNYLGAKKQADAIKDAAHIQDAATTRALDFTKQQYADVTGRLKPYVDAGGTASDAASRLLQSSPYAAAIRPQPSVTLRAPDGSTKQFVAGDPMIARATQAGAQLVPQPLVPQGAA